MIIEDIICANCGNPVEFKWDIISPGPGVVESKTIMSCSCKSPKPVCPKCGGNIEIIEAWAYDNPYSPIGPSVVCSECGAEYY